MLKEQAAGPEKVALFDAQANLGFDVACLSKGFGCARGLPGEFGAARLQAELLYLMVEVGGARILSERLIKRGGLLKRIEFQKDRRRPLQLPGLGEHLSGRLAVAALKRSLGAHLRRPFMVAALLEHLGRFERQRRLQQPFGGARKVGVEAQALGALLQEFGAIKYIGGQLELLVLLP